MDETHLNTGLCIGGPWDGLVKTGYRDSATLVVPIVSHAFVINSETENVSTQAGELRYIIYRRAFLHLGGEDNEIFVVWLVEGMTRTEALKRLYTGYVPGVANGKTVYEQIPWKAKEYIAMGLRKVKSDLALWLKTSSNEDTVAGLENDIAYVDNILRIFGWTEP